MATAPQRSAMNSRRLIPLPAGPRGEHSFASPAQLEKLLSDAGFVTVDVQTVVQTIAFPSVLDYVRFQLMATPMTILLRDKSEPERQAIISSVASRAATLSTPAMLDGGKFTFPQEAYVAIAWPSSDVG